MSMGHDTEPVRDRVRRIERFQAFGLTDPDETQRFLSTIFDGDSGEDAEPVEPPKPVSPRASAPDNAVAGLLTLDQAAAYLTITDEQLAAFVAGWRARLHQHRSRQEATALPVHQARP